MPKQQTGSVVKRGPGNWAVRYYDENDVRQYQGGFKTQTDAERWKRDKVDEIHALRRGDIPAIRRQNMPTVGELVVEFLEQHNAKANTLRTLAERLRYATDGPELDGKGGWRDVRVDRIDGRAIGGWRKRLPERSAWGIHKAARQLGNYAVRVELVDRNPFAAVPNPEPKRREILAFADVAELEIVAAELPAQTRQIPLVAGLTGARPEEWLAFERGDLDRRAGVIHVRRVYVDGRVERVGKQSRSLRAIPLADRALQALEEIPPRIDTPLLFPGAKGGYLNLHDWSRDYWAPALVGARLGHRGVYALRHTYASLSIAAGVSMFELARFMGTSVDQIDDTYGHLLPDSIDRAKAALNKHLGRLGTDRAQTANGSDD
jgi:integrase